MKTSKSDSHPRWNFSNILIFTGFMGALKLIFGFFCLCNNFASVGAKKENKNCPVPYLKS
jgi:vacuolar-type H+-ATPase subunit I/STV1